MSIVQIWPKNEVLDAFLLANRSSIKEELVKQGWNPDYINIPDFRQDIYGSEYTDENENKVFVKPTFNWHTNISSQRLFDGGYFFCRVVVLDEELRINKNNVEVMTAILDEDFKNAVETMKDQGLCENCGVDKIEKCEKHG